MQAFLGAIEGVLKNNNFSNLEWYIIYTFIGISLMLWCYFSWDFKLKSIPRFGVDNVFITIKKSFVFICVMTFSFYYGYKTLNKAIVGEEIDIVTSITNATIVPGIIAFDRVLNQIMVLKKRK